MAILAARYTCYGGYGNGCYSTWNGWARWLVLGLIIAAAILFFFAFACISARRRRRMGNQPWRGTGWAVGHTAPGHGQPAYNPNTAQPYYANTAPPAYQPPANQSYYGQPQTELQQPAQAYGGYRSGESAYEPPKGPPPAHAQ